jgi:ATP-dependent DNA helicase RecQ
VALDDLRAELPSIAASKVKVAARLLATRGVVKRTKDGALRLAKPPLAAPDIAALAQVYEQREQDDREKLERMVFYAQTGQCRWRVLLDYFGERLAGDACETCDNCRRARERETEQKLVDIVAPMQRRREFAEGDAVRIPRVGAGVVRGVLGNEVTVELADGSTRTFLRSYVRRDGAGRKREAITADGPALAAAA